MSIILPSYRRLAIRRAIPGVSSMYLTGALTPPIWKLTRRRFPLTMSRRFLRHKAQEPRVDPEVAGQLRVERGADEMALAGEDDPLLERPDRFARSPGPRDLWGADEDAVKGPIEDGDLDVPLEG